MNFTSRFLFACILSQIRIHHLHHKHRIRILEGSSDLFLQDFHYIIILAKNLGAHAVGLDFNVGVYVQAVDKCLDRLYKIIAVQRVVTDFDGNYHLAGLVVNKCMC